MLGVLYREGLLTGSLQDKEHKQGSQKLTPVVYTALASPMMGSRQHARVLGVNEQIVEFIGPVLPRTFKHLMLLDGNYYPAFTFKNSLITRL